MVLTTHRRLFEIIQDVILQYKPSTMLGLVLPSLLGQPSCLLRVKERFSKVTHPRDLELFSPYILKEVLTGSNYGE